MNLFVQENIAESTTTVWAVLASTASCTFFVVLENWANKKNSTGEQTRDSPGGGCLFCRLAWSHTRFDPGLARDGKGGRESWRFDMAALLCAYGRQKISPVSFSDTRQALREHTTTRHTR